MTQKNQRSFSVHDIRSDLFFSAKTKQRLHKLLPVVDHVAEQHALRIPTHLLNDVVSDAVAMNPPPTDKGKRLRINYATQVAVKPPTFVLFVNDPEMMHFSYERYLENKSEPHSVSKERRSDCLRAGNRRRNRRDAGFDDVSCHC